LKVACIPPGEVIPLLMKNEEKKLDNRGVLLDTASAN
jgi:hypothetical protein